MAKVPPEERILNIEQRRAVEFGTGPLLVIAGAGSGKTTVVTERIKHIIASGAARADEILALTFTEKASQEMEARVDVALPYGTTQMWISTFHAFCDRVLRNDAVNMGLDPGYKLMNEAETILFFRKNLFKFELKYFRPLGNPNKFIAGMIGHFSRLKDEDVSPDAYRTYAHTVESHSSIGDADEIARVGELARAYQTYEDLKVKESVADYSDLISNTLRLFRTRKNILARYQDMFKYVLIDEFQDTNFAQNELAVMLAGSRKNITVVGDDDQAIYRWRGAAISNIIQFKKRFPAAQIVVLTKNYRSTKEILDRSYTLIRFNDPDRLEVAEKIDKKLECMRRVEGKPVEVIYADRVETEAEEAVKRIKKLTAGGNHPHLHFRDIAILVRANNQSEPFVRALSRAGVPYQFLGPGQLFRQPEVKDLIAYLKVLYNFEDNVAMYRVLVMDLFGFGAREIATLLNYSKKLGLSLYEGCERLAGTDAAAAKEAGRPVADAPWPDRFQSSYQMPAPAPETVEKAKKIVRMIQKHMTLIKKETAGQILYYFLEDTGLLKSLTSYKTVKDERVANNIAKFFTKLKSYEAGHDDNSVYAVVDWIDLSMNLGESPLAADMDWMENDAVNILTVHSAKGLEFPAVFLVNLVASRFPTIERKEQIPIPDALIKEILPSGDFHTQEERRLFYVGMTRARDYLFLTAAKFYGEGKRERKISPFVGEALGEEAVAKVTGKAIGGAKQLSLLEWAKVPETPDRAPVKQQVDYLSYSQLDSFITCPLQYKYRYILKIPVPPTAALTFGDAMHRTVRAFYEDVKRGGQPTLDDLLGIYNRFWNPLGYGNKSYADRMKKHGVELLTGFYEKGYDPERIPSDLEKPFKLRITPALKLAGKIDRVDPLPGGGIEIIDYKTGAAPTTKDVRKDLQLSVYALAATDDGIFPKKPGQVTVSFYFFENQEKISSTRTPEQLADTKKFIAEKADEISRSDFPANPGRQCDYCEFRLICEAWQ